MNVYMPMRIVPTPGNDIFFDYTHNWIDKQFQLTTQDRRVDAKISYTHRF